MKSEVLNNAGCGTKQSSPIEIAVGRVNKELTTLQDCVTNLQERLLSVMIPEKPVLITEEKIKDLEISPLCDSIKEACDKITAEKNRVSDILTRLQI